MSNSNSLKKRIFAAIIAGTMLMSMSLTGCNNNGGAEESSDSSSVVSEVSVVQKFGNDIAVKTDNYSVPLPIVSYFFNYYYSNYISNYGSYMTSYYGFDEKVDLKEQYQDEENKVTWYDFFMNNTINYLSETIILAEAAKADGMELDENDLKTIDENLNSLNKSASSNNISEEEYIEKYYGEGVTKAYVEDFLKATTLAQKYYNKIYDGYKYTDKDYENYYAENKTSYQYADFLDYVFNVSYAEDATDDEKKEANDEAKAYADGLSKCKTEDEFKEYVKKYLEQHPEIITKNTTTSTSSSEESKMTDEEIKEAIEKKVESVVNKRYAYEVSSNVGKWVFDGSREAFDTTVVSESNAYIAVMMVKPAYRDESTYKNVRHILIKNDYTVDENATDEEKQAAKEKADKEAKEKADKIYKEWQDGKATEDSFAELAGKYTEDPGSEKTGGLYENIYEGQMVPEFNDWCFDSKRKIGDTGIVKTTHGYHIMYFSGNTDPAWKVGVDTAMRGNDFNEDYKKLQEKYPVQTDKDYLYTISVKSGPVETSSAS